MIAARGVGVLLMGDPSPRRGSQGRCLEKGPGRAVGRGGMRALAVLGRTGHLLRTTENRVRPERARGASRDVMQRRGGQGPGQGGLSSGQLDFPLKQGGEPLRDFRSFWQMPELCFRGGSREEGGTLCQQTRRGPTKGWTKRREARRPTTGDWDLGVRLPLHFLLCGPERVSQLLCLSSLA